MIDIVPYENLANAIIIRACEDYKTGMLSELGFRNFCRSSWFRVLTKVNPEYLIKEMEIKRKEYLNDKKKRYKK